MRSGAFLALMEVSMDESASPRAHTPTVPVERMPEKGVRSTDTRGGQGGTEAAGPWLGYDEVFFDCDSTLTAIEGIEELARLKGMGGAISGMTQRAMEGEVRLEDVYAERLDLLCPTRAELQRIALGYREGVVPDARQVIAALRYLGRRVHIVSGGIAEPVIAFGNWLGVATDCIHAVGLEFDQLAGRWWEYRQRSKNPAERYLGFVPGPLSESRGKAAVINQVRRKPGRALLVGDGVSDLLARPAVELVVGFGGVVHRKRVASEADIFVASAGLAPILPLVARPQEYEHCLDTPRQALFDRGMALIFGGHVLFNHQWRKRSFYGSYQALHPWSDRGAA